MRPERRDEVEARAKQKPIERAAERCDGGGMDRLSMRKIREILRLKHSGCSQREIASSVAVAVGTINGHLQRAQQAGLTWDVAQSMTDAEVEAALFRDVGRNEGATRAAIDYGHVHAELSRLGVTLQLLWFEYQESVAARGDGTKPYQYSQFCELYAAWRVRLKPSMRRVHRAGEKAFVDYSGKKLRLRFGSTRFDPQEHPLDLCHERRSGAFLDVVLCPELQGDSAIRVGVSPRPNDDRNPGCPPVLLESRQQIPAVGVWHGNVEDDDVWHGKTDLSHHIGPVECLPDHEPLLLERAFG